MSGLRRRASARQCLKLLRLEAREDLLGHVFEDVPLVLVCERGDAFDDRLEVVEHLASLRILVSTSSGVLGAEHAAVGAHDTEQQIQTFDVVEHRVEVELLELDVEATAAFEVAPEECAVASNLVRHRSATVADDDLEIWEAVKGPTGQHRDNGSCFGGDEV